MKHFIFLLLFFSHQAFASQEKYSFLFLYKDYNPQTQKMEGVFKNALNKTDRATGEVLQKNDPKAIRTIQQYSLQHAPMPFVLVLAPNGAIMGGFPVQFTEDELLSTFSTPVVESCLKALQDRKLVLLSMQNDQTLHNKEAMLGVQAFATDPQYKNAIVTLTLDPKDPENLSFFSQLNITPNQSEASTLFLAPPADRVGYFIGPTTKEQLTSSLKRATSGCCPGGCCILAESVVLKGVKNELEYSCFS